jgi:hypothetical protein
MFVMAFDTVGFVQLDAGIISRRGYLPVVGGALMAFFADLIGNGWLAFEDGIQRAPIRMTAVAVDAEQFVRRRDIPIHVDLSGLDRFIPEPCQGKYGDNQ